MATLGVQAQQPLSTAESQSLERTLILRIGHLPEFTVTDVVRQTIDDLRYTYIYYQQYHQGKEVYKATGVLALSPYAEHSTHQRLVTEPKIDQRKAVGLSKYQIFETVITHLDMPLKKSQGTWTKVSKDNWKIGSLPYTREDVEMRPVWYVTHENHLASAWAVLIDPSVNQDVWEIVVSEETGQILSEVNVTSYCQFSTTHQHDHRHCKKDNNSAFLETGFPEMGVNDGSQYVVWAPPLESPLEGERTVVSDPADNIASPFGWHDDNGQNGPEYRTLRGNNAHAYQDTADIDEPRGIEPRAAEGLIFAFPYDAEASPIENLGADLTNLFFWNNYVHDWAYRLGFDESSGNFQFNNYGKGGRDGDEVLAESLDGSDINNASFSAPRDGFHGRMQMYKWLIGNQFEILSPSSIAGDFTTGAAGFGPQLDASITANIVIANDGSGVSTDVCQSIINRNDIRGNIALIDRGTCDFSFKTYQAQLAGAIGCIICNNLDNAPLITMGAGQNADDVSIPALFLSKEDCAIIREQVTNNTVTATINKSREVSSALDNGIVAHEYGHGISTRLAGGPNNSNCLSNDEQAGEGWSDFFALVLTQQPTDTRATKRPIGTFVAGQSRAEGDGIRRYPYSYDMEINPQIHSHIRFTDREHDVGELWTAVLWDLYWDYVDVYGYDPSWLDNNSGNMKMLRLVFDGLRIQECDASLQEARDALFDADVLLTNGEDRCLIWKAFARRGFGEDAIGGNSDDRGDNVDGFDIPISCYDTIAITKTMTPLVEAGDAISVSINIQNESGPLGPLMLVEEIPPNTTPANLPSGVSVAGDQLHIQLPSLSDGQSLTIDYQLETDDITPANVSFNDQMNGAQNFTFFDNDSNVNPWRYGKLSDEHEEIIQVLPDTFGGESYAMLTDAFMIGENSTLLQFDHRYEMDLGIDGGVIQVSIDQGESWSDIAPEDFLVNGYTDEITNCLSNCPIPDYFYRNVTKAYTGEQGWHTSILNLSNYVGQQVMIRFSYISLLWEDDLSDTGWIIDNVVLLEKKVVASRSWLVENDVDTLQEVLAVTIIGGGEQTTPVTEIVAEDYHIKLSPNPADYQMQCSIYSNRAYDGQIRIFGVDGRLHETSVIKIPSGQSIHDLNIGSIMPGTYFVEVQLDTDLRHTLSFIKI